MPHSRESAFQAGAGRTKREGGIIMRTLSVLSRKGGSGKTTLTLHLAVAAEQAGLRVLVIDVDPQASAVSWYEKREEKTPLFIKAGIRNIAQAVRASEEYGIDLVLIDSPPHTEQVASAAAQVADLVIIPTRPSILDLEAIGGTVDIVKSVHRAGLIVLNACPARSPVTEEARRALACYGVPVAPLTIGNRIAFQHALNSGHAVCEFDPRSKAAAEITALWHWMSWTIGLTDEHKKAVA